MNHRQNGFFAGQSGMVGKPPYDPRDPLTMSFVNEYNQGYDEGCRVALGAMIRLNNQLNPDLPRNNR